MRSNRLKQAIREGKPVSGLFCSTPAPLIVEMIGHAGFDFVILDMEHTLISPDTLEQMIRAAETVGLTPLVRVPSAGSPLILQALDAGAQGIVVPRVRSGADVELAVRASHYWPEGERGLNAGRPAAFGKVDLREYVRSANEQVLLVAMLEDRQGFEALDEILDTAGIDLVLEGAADLSQSLGMPWETRHPRVRELLEVAHSEASKRGIPFCAIPRATEDFAFWRERGVRTFILGDDRGIAFRAYRSQLETFRSALSSQIGTP